MLERLHKGVEGYHDLLGTIYESEGFCDQPYAKQFFTPDALSEAIARMTIGEPDDLPRVVTLAEPRCGSGRLVFSACRDGSASTWLWIEATDLDQCCSLMAFIQMAFAGVPGVVRRANTISRETFGWAVSPRGRVRYASSEYLRAWLANDTIAAEPTPEPVPALVQGKLLA